VGSSGGHAAGRVVDNRPEKAIFGTRRRARCDVCRIPFPGAVCGLASAAVLSRRKCGDVTSFIKPEDRPLTRSRSGLEGVRAALRAGSDPNRADKTTASADLAATRGLSRRQALLEITPM